MTDKVDMFREWERTHNRENYGRYDAFAAGFEAGRRAGLSEAAAHIESYWQPPYAHD
jgi:hypothetical protein